MKKYKILEDVAIADIAIEAYGKNLNQLFENTAFAIFEESKSWRRMKRRPAEPFRRTSLSHRPSEAACHRPNGAATAETPGRRNFGNTRLR